MKKPAIAVRENRIDDKNKTSLFFIFLIDKNVPDAAMPNKAMLTTIKAK